jgi:hypothetical protein
MFVAATLLSAAAITAAEARPMSSRMACTEVQKLVTRSGAVVMSFTPTTYDRVVADSRWCLRTERLDPIYVPARDSGACFAGYVCRERDFSDW